MLMISDVKCYHCGHVSGQIEATKEDRLVIQAFKPREGYKGPKPKPGDSLRCERCGGPVFLEDLREAPIAPLAIDLSVARKLRRKSRGKAAA